MRAAGVLVLAALSISCAGGMSKTKSVLPASPAKIPARLMLEHEIAGRILSYDLKDPHGLAVDALGNLYIADAGNHRVVKLDPQFKPLREYGGYGSGVGRFSSPEDLVIDRGLNLYVLDAGNRRIVQLDAGLNYVNEIIPEDDSTEIISNKGRLTGLSISPLGEITVADADNSRLIRMDNFNHFSRYVGDFGYGRGSLLLPAGMAVDGDGRIWVADGGNGRIAVYDDYGNYLFEIGAGHLKSPAAVAIAPSGAVWAADRGMAAVYAFAADGRLLLKVAAADGEEFTFADVEAIAVSRDDRLYVADSGGNRVLVYRIIYEPNQ
jgi:tripartite motif-containing protein 71